MIANPGRRSGPRPGDGPAPENPDAGENVRPTCDGPGHADGANRRACGGTGRVAEDLGGG